MSQERVVQIQQRMAEQQLDAVVLYLAENIVLTSGFYVRIPGLGMIAVPREGQATLMVADYDLDRARRTWEGDLRTFTAVADTTGLEGPLTKNLQGLLGVGPSVDRFLREFAAEHGARGGRVGFEGSFEQVAPPILVEPNTVGLPTQEFLRATFETEALVDFTDALEDIRSVKLPHDLEKLAIADEIVRFGMDAFRAAATPGATEAEVRSAIESAICNRGHGYRGVETVRATCCVAAGDHLLSHGWNYPITGSRRIEDGDLVMVEMGTVVDGYWADTTRTLVAGRPGTELQREADAVVRAAIEAALATAVPGATGGEVDAAARGVCVASGLDGVYPHQTGHGTGFRYHEMRPNLVPKGSSVLREGMCLALEPAFYSEALGGGVRHEHNAYVTADGAVPFGSLDFPFDGP
ncbi:MAG: aminopeptidase P family protein [Solirubrobacterales bacterium]|nr:aminopeptidase P family protein [Solirubrobacterales bacterium]